MSGKKDFLAGKGSGKEKARSTNICVVGQNIEHCIFLPAKVPTRICFARQNVEQSIYSLSEVFCWRGGQLFSYTMQPPPDHQAGITGIRTLLLNQTWKR